MDVVVAKLTSGKYYLTIITGLVFLYASITGKIEKDVIGTIIVTVFTLYFTRKSSNGEQAIK